jgi:hypothetical protein
MNTRQQMAHEMQAILEKMEQRGIVINTGRKQWGSISQRWQTVYDLAPGVTYEEYRRAMRDN